MALPFEQQTKESAKAYAAFRTYLDMGAERSLGAVARKLDKSVTLLGRWSKKFDWMGRVQAHEAHLVTVERQATEVAARGKAVNWLARQQEIREREWEMHEKCIAAAKEGLRRFMANLDKGATLGEVARMLDVASKLGRLAAGMATNKTEVSGEIDVNLRVEIEQAIKRVYGQVEEAGSTQLGAGSGGAGNPHPGPLPKGEGIGNGLAVGGGTGDGGLKANVEHSTSNVEHRMEGNQGLLTSSATIGKE